MNRDQLEQAITHGNVRAFLRVVRAGESSQSEVAYRMMFGGALFAVPPWEHPRQKITIGNLTSTAAGAYQALAGTWDDFLRWGGDADFSPPNQDVFAGWCIVRRGALEDLVAGRFGSAVTKCAAEWASLPGSPYGQPTISMAKALAVYQEYGGRLSTAEALPPSLGPSIPQEEPASRILPGSAISGPIAQTKGSPMLPILAAVLPALFQAAPTLIGLFGKGGEITTRNQAVAQAVADVAMKVTGAMNEQEAAARITADPAMAERFQAAVNENFDRWMGMMVKFAELDEASRGKAREFVMAYDRSPVLFKFTFVELLSLLFLTIAAAGGGYVLYGEFTPEIKGAVITLMLIGGFTGVKEFWFGSSMGSMRKDQTIQQQSERTP